MTLAGKSRRRLYSIAIKFSDGAEALIVVRGNTREAAKKRARRHATKDFRAIVVLGPALPGDVETPLPRCTACLGDGDLPTGPHGYMRCTKCGGTGENR